MTYFTPKQMTENITKETLPAILFDLILASVNKFSRFSIPVSNLSGNFGFDGIIEIPDDVETLLIPTGKLVFEISVQADVKGKAEKDYNKRIQGVEKDSLKDITYIAVTSQIFNQKDEWINEKKQNEDFPWKDLLCISQADLHTWFNLCPSVAIKWGEMWGIEINSLYTLNSVLVKWGELFENVLKQDTFFSLVRALGPEESSKSILIDFFSGEDPKFVITASSVEEARLYVASVLYEQKNQLSSELKTDFFLDKVVCLENADIFKKLPLKQYEGLIFITSLQDADVISRATKNGIKVIQVLRHLYTHENANIKLPIRINGDCFFNVLDNSGIGLELNRNLAQKSGRNISTLRSVITKEPLPWAKDFSPSLLAALLVGGWSSEKEDDIKIMCTLSGMSEYASFTQELTKYLNKENSPIQHEKPYYRSVSSFSAFPALKQHITSELLQKYEKACISILAKDDQIKNLPYSEQPFASLQDIENDFSPLLRKSMADSLIHLSILYDDEKHIISKIITSICNGDITRWKSISPYLLELAEAAPLAYLNELENFIKNDVNDELNTLVNSSHNVLESFGDYISILFSLELLAWEDEYLEQVTKILLSLIPKLDNIPENTMNSPLSTLVTIFCIWYPQTQATVSKRNAILKRLLPKYPKERHSLLIKLLPTSAGSFITSNVLPKWTWKHEYTRDRAISHDEYNEALTSVVELAIEYCHENVDIILQLIQASCHAQISEESIKSFQKKFEIMSLRREDNYNLWNKLRDFLIDEIRYSRNSRNGELIKYFFQKYTEFEPTNLYKKNAHYFIDPFNCVEIAQQREPQCNIDDRVVSKQKEAIIAIFSDKKSKGIVEFLDFLSMPENTENLYNANKGVGYIFSHLFSLGLDARDFDELIQRVSSSDTILRSFKLILCEKYAQTYLSTNLGDNVAFYGKFSSDFVNYYLLSLPFSRELFEHLNTSSKSIQEYYWKNISESQLANASFQKEIIQELIRFKNFSVSSRLLAIFYKSITEFDLISKTLKGLLAEKSTYYSKMNIEILFERVKCTHSEHEKMMILEWQFFQILKNNARRIYKEMANNPSYFMMFISYAFKSTKGENIEATPEASRQAYDILKVTSLNNAPLLNAFRDVNGKLHFEILFHWFSSVKDIAKKQGYEKIAMAIAGEHLAYSCRIDGLNELLSNDDGDVLIQKNEIFPEGAIRELLNKDEFQELHDVYITSFLNRFGSWSGSGVIHYKNMKNVVENNQSKISHEYDLLRDMFRKLLERIDEHINWSTKHEQYEDLGA